MALQLQHLDGGWSQITSCQPDGRSALRIEARLVAGWGAGDTWYWEAATGWHYLTGVGPETTACYRGQLAWEGAAGPGTWLYNFTTASWAQITPNNPEQMLAWGPNLVWENAALGTWIWDGGAWTQITAANPTRIEVLGADLLWSYPKWHVGVEWRRRRDRLDQHHRCRAHGDREHGPGEVAQPGVTRRGPWSPPRTIERA